MEDSVILSHTKWECKCHIVWIPNLPKKMLFGKLRTRWEKYLVNLHGREKALS